MNAASRVDRRIGIAWAQDDRKKKQAQKTSSTDEGMERREENASINLTKGHALLVSNKASPHLLILPGKSMIVINPLMNKIRGAIEPSYF